MPQGPEEEFGRIERRAKAMRLAIRSAMAQTSAESSNEMRRLADTTEGVFSAAAGHISRVLSGAVKVTKENAQQMAVALKLVSDNVPKDMNAKFVPAMKNAALMSAAAFKDSGVDISDTIRGIGNIQQKTSRDNLMTQMMGAGRLKSLTKELLGDSVNSEQVAASGISRGVL